MENKVIDKKDQEGAIDNYYSTLGDSEFNGCLFVFDDKLMEDHAIIKCVFSDSNLQY